MLDVLKAQSHDCFYSPSTLLLQGISSALYSFNYPPNAGNSQLYIKVESEIYSEKYIEKLIHSIN